MREVLVPVEIQLHQWEGAGGAPAAQQDLEIESPWPGNAHAECSPTLHVAWW